jgi:preprotein translocase subunit SecE
MDKVKLTIAVLLLAAGVAGFYYFADQSLLMRVLGLLVVAGVSLAIAYQTAAGQRTWGFVTASQIEVKKVVWPTRKETLQTTGIVLLMVLLAAIFMWALDSTLLWLVRLLTGQGE